MTARLRRARGQEEPLLNRFSLCIVTHRFSAGAGSENSTAAWRFLHSAGRQYSSFFVPGKSTDDQYDRKAVWGRVGWPGDGVTWERLRHKSGRIPAWTDGALCLQRAVGQLRKLVALRRQFLRGRVSPLRAHPRGA